MSSIQSLLETMQKLRDQDTGCPWDIEQTFESLSNCMVEEAYEVVDAISRKDYENLKEELGDVLLQVIFHSQIANELGLFNFEEVTKTLNQKLIRRHPHVFSGALKPLSSAEQTKVWDAIKKEEKKDTLTESIFDDVPASMPPSLRAEKIQKKVSKKGFDWQSTNEVMEKVEEELNELKLAMNLQNIDNTKEEMGDLLFSIINLSRHLNIDSNDSLVLANQKFINRFNLVEKQLGSENKLMENVSLEDLEKIWVKVKSYE